MTSLPDMYRTRVAGVHPKRVRVIQTFETVDNEGNKKDFDVVTEYEPDYPLRYGTNPHQPSAHYKTKSPLSLREVKTGKSGMSQTNLEDLLRATGILKYFSDPACAVMKHLNPSGVAVRSTLPDAFEYAWNCDFQAGYGSVVVFNNPIGRDVVDATRNHYIEVLVAPDFDEGVLDSLERRRDLRVIQLSGIDELPKFVGDETVPNLKIYEGMLFLETPYLTRIRNAEDLQNRDKEKLPAIVTERQPTGQELMDMVSAWHACSQVRSNGIVLWKSGYSIGIGTGQQDRVTAVRQAIAKNGYLNEAARRENIQRGDYNLAGAVIASDGFFPFSDSIDVVNEAGITGVIQPGGSIRDQDVIDAANKYGMTMVFTGERCFSHH